MKKRTTKGTIIRRSLILVGVIAILGLTLVTPVIQATNFWNSVDNIEIFVNGNKSCSDCPHYSTSWQFTSNINVFDKQWNCQCFSLQLNLFDGTDCLAAQSVFQMRSSDVWISIQSVPAPSCFNQIQVNFQLDTGISTSSILTAHDTFKTEFNLNSNNLVTGAYWVILNQRDKVIYTYSKSQSLNSFVYYGESAAVGLGGSSNAQFTSTTGDNLYQTDSGSLAQQNLHVNNPSLESSNMQYSSTVSGLGRVQASQAFCSEDLSCP